LLITETGTVVREISISIYITVGLLRALGMTYIKSAEGDILNVI